MAWFWKQRAHYRPQRTADLPPGRAPETPDPAPVPVTSDLVDWPRIASRHPHWWQVFRIEHHGFDRRYALIAEVRTEDEAFRVAAQQASQVRITKFPPKAQPYESFRAPLMVITGTVREAEER